jgi:hypothetical protein
MTGTGPAADFTVCKLGSRRLFLPVAWLVLSCDASPPSRAELEATRGELAAPARMDVVSAGSADPVGIWENPLWGSQATVPGSLADPQACLDLTGGFRDTGCTTQSVFLDYPSGFNALICAIGASTEVYGHVDWRAANYGGMIYWGGKSTDADYNVRIPTVNRNGLTLYNPTTMHGEFDSRETINYFSSQWWVSFRSASDTTKQTMINGKQAIVVGLLGVDCEHDCGSEVHPIWALAIHVKDDPKDDVWALFGRNFGDEGFCSSYQHLIYFPGDRYTFELPWRAGATGVSRAPGTVFYANKSGMSTSWGFVAGDHVTLTMQLLSPTSYPRLHGELHLSWSGAAVASTATGRPGAFASDKENGDRALADLAASLDPEQRAAFERATAVRSARDSITVPVTQGRAQPATDLARATIVPLPDPATAAANMRLVLALREAYGRPFPGELGALIERAFAAR